MTELMDAVRNEKRNLETERATLTARLKEIKSRLRAIETFEGKLSGCA
jgi:chaperonin cofactor prefoldin